MVILPTQSFNKKFGYDFQLHRIKLTTLSFTIIGITDIRQLYVVFL
jgi:hypothetical protein